ncbi:hypothetical protein DFH09DRAFT_830369, partial [Mycena vulgaris]
MPPATGPLWAHFHQSDTKPNGVHFRATHWHCIDARRSKDEPIDVDASANVTLIKNAKWFADALTSAIEAGCNVNGEKKAMAGHLRRCAHAMAKEKALAAQVSPTKAEQKASADDEADVTQGRKKRKMVKAVEKSFTQSKLEVFKGLDIPFSAAQTDTIRAQFLRATQSANLPERWTSDAEALKLFMMFRLRAEEVIPSRTQLGGSLLKDASDRIDAEIPERILGEDVLMCTDGWRSNAKDSVGGVSVSHKFKSILIDLIFINAWNKDGESMALQFANMIDEAEEKWGCNVLGFLTDNDTGRKKGKKLLGIARAWLLLFKTNGLEYRNICSDRAYPGGFPWVEPVSCKVRTVGGIQDVWGVRGAQATAPSQPRWCARAYTECMGPSQRWTTHLVAALRFFSLKTPICATILNKRDEIVAAHIGAKSNRRKHDEMREVALGHCATRESNTWWDELEKIIPDLEHICYLTNIAQSDHVRPDQFLLS